MRRAFHSAASVLILLLFVLGGTGHGFAMATSLSGAHSPLAATSEGSDHVIAHNVVRHCTDHACKANSQPCCVLGHCLMAVEPDPILVQAEPMRHVQAAPSGLMSIGYLPGRLYRPPASA
jgi:hypothetical protein